MLFHRKGLEGTIAALRGCDVPSVNHIEARVLDVALQIDPTDRASYVTAYDHLSLLTASLIEKCRKADPAWDLVPVPGGRRMESGDTNE
jgi:hypothetical protein